MRNPTSFCNYRSPSSIFLLDSLHLPKSIAVLKITSHSKLTDAAAKHAAVSGSESLKTFTVDASFQHLTPFRLARNLGLMDGLYASFIQG